MALADRGQLGSAVADVLRSKSLRLIAERAKVTDESGRGVDLKELARADEPAGPDDAAEPEAELAAEGADEGSGA